MKRGTGGYLFFVCNVDGRTDREVTVSAAELVLSLVLAPHCRYNLLALFLSFSDARLRLSTYPKYNGGFFFIAVLDRMY